MPDHSETIFENAKTMFGYLVIGLKDLQWEQLPQAVIDFLKANPGTSAFQLICLITVAVPGVVATPALLSLGFGSSGPMAGWLAPAFQSGYGTPVVFSALQSAAMGGWGTAIVNTIVQSSALIAGVTKAVGFNLQDRSNYQ